MSPCKALIIDVRPLCRAAMAAFVSRWTGSVAIEVVSVAADSFEDVPRELSETQRHEVAICILVAGSQAEGKGSINQCLEFLAATLPASRLVVIADAGSREDIAAAASAGAHGYIFSTDSVEFVDKALDFIMSGGEYFPSAVLHLRFQTSPA